MDLKLNGRSVLVTGGSKGIGYAVAKWFAAEGCDVNIAARSADMLAAAAASIRSAHPVQVRAHALDLADAAARAVLEAACPEVDILVNNAGATPGGSIETVHDAEWRAGWELKVFGYINLSRAYMARMKARGRGVIVNVIGTAGEKYDANYIAGASGNAALIAFTKALGSNSLESGIRVVGVNPGPVATERDERLQRGKAKRLYGDESRWQELRKGLPLGRAATPDEIAAAVVFLASDLSSYTSGTVLNIDGGLMYRR